MVPPRPFPHGQQDVSYHSSSGTSVYWPQMDVGAAMQTHGRTGPVVGAGYPGYQLMPAAATAAYVHWECNGERGASAGGMDLGNSVRGACVLHLILWIAVMFCV